MFLAERKMKTDEEDIAEVEQYFDVLDVTVQVY